MIGESEFCISEASLMFYERTSVFECGDKDVVCGAVANSKRSRCSACSVSHLCMAG